uniref:TOBE domain-containing protein n=1 Tax=Vibrio crassostreae TaxID=246167 RepID=UPI001BD52773
EPHQQGTNKQSDALSLELESGCYLWATITLWALDELNLEIGQRVYAQIKGVSVAQRDMAVTH